MSALWRDPGGFMLIAFPIFFALLARLGGLGRHFFANLSQDGAKMAQHSAKMSQHSAKMAQHAAKIAQHSLQEQPQDPKKPSKVMYCRRFLVFVIFSKIAPKMQKKRRQDAP